MEVNHSSFVGGQVSKSEVSQGARPDFPEKVLLHSQREANDINNSGIDAAEREIESRPDRWTVKGLPAAHY
jgi:hypothetical protein